MEDEGVRNVKAFLVQAVDDDGDDSSESTEKGSPIPSPSCKEFSSAERE